MMAESKREGGTDINSKCGKVKNANKTADPSSSFKSRNEGAWQAEAKTCLYDGRFEEQLTPTLVRIAVTSSEPEGT